MSDIPDHYGYRLEDFDRAIDRAIADEQFREQLLADPKAALRSEGVNLPDHVKVTVHEFDLDDRHYILPPAAMTELGPARAFMLPVVEETR